MTGMEDFIKETPDSSRAPSSRKAAVCSLEESLHRSPTTLTPSSQLPTSNCKREIAVVYVPSRFMAFWGSSPHGQRQMSSVSFDLSSFLHRTLCLGMGTFAEDRMDVLSNVPCSVFVGYFQMRSGRGFGGDTPGVMLWPSWCLTSGDIGRQSVPLSVMRGQSLYSGRRNETPQAGWLGEQKCIVSALWRLQVPDQDASRFAFLQGLSPCLADGLPVTASSLVWCLFVCPNDLLQGHRADWIEPILMASLTQSPEVLRFRASTYELQGDAI